ncbi:Protein toll [Halotydeus destructor]|nr:Protein toll [Halotydeus destructor]
MEMIEKLEKPSEVSNYSISYLQQQLNMPSIHEGIHDRIVPDICPEFKGKKDQDAEDSQFYDLCIHERDWLPGNLISWNIVNSVQNSKRTILILSKEFIQSIWFQVEFHTAYYQMLEDKMDRLIVVVKGDLPPKEELDKELVFLLTTKTYLVWGEKWFWEKLRYALPHKRKMAPVVKGQPVANGASLSQSKSGKMSKADIMKEYVDQTIANHFQLQPSSPVKASLDTNMYKNGDNEAANKMELSANKHNQSSNRSPRTPSHAGHINESFVIETET